MHAIWQGIDSTGKLSISYEAGVYYRQEIAKIKQEAGDMNEIK
jgi:hypothetical protein